MLMDVQTRFKYKNILFNANIEWVNSKNYLWTKGQNQNNLYVNFNTNLFMVRKIFTLIICFISLQAVGQNTYLDEIQNF